jgi:hypothetical protein
VDLLADGVGSLSAQDAAELDAIEKRLLWLSVLIVHWANHVRPNLDGLKVGGHQASSASCVSLMTALSFQHLSSVDRVAVKPHAAPVLYAIEVSGDRPSAACGGLPTGRGSSPPRSNFEWTFVAGTEDLIDRLAVHPQLEATRTSPDSVANLPDEDA